MSGVYGISNTQSDSMQVEGVEWESYEIKLGMQLLGAVFSSMLYGITLSQTFSYYRRFPKDPLPLKWMVAFMTLLDAASAFLITHGAWFYLVSERTIEISVWSMNAELALSMVISALVELFLTYRVWMLSGGNVALTISLLVLALVHFVSGEYGAYQFFKLKEFSLFGVTVVPGILRLSSAAMSDTGIAISLCYFLHKMRTGYHRSRTDRVIDRLSLYAINSGLVTSVASVVCLITFLAIPSTWVFLALCFLISKLYVNTFLCSLNSRQIIKQDVDELETKPLSLPITGSSHTDSFGRHSVAKSRPISNETIAVPRMVQCKLGPVPGHARLNLASESFLIGRSTKSEFASVLGYGRTGEMSQIDVYVDREVVITRCEDDSTTGHDGHKRSPTPSSSTLVMA